MKWVKPCEKAGSFGEKNAAHHQTSREDHSCHEKPEIPFSGLDPMLCLRETPVKRFHHELLD